MHINESAPVTATGTIRIVADPGLVWDLLTDINRWSEWNADVRSSSLPGPVASGAVFRWRAGPAKLVSTIQVVDRPVEIGWTGRTMGMNAVHVWRLDRHGETTVVHTQESWEGLPARLLPLTMRKSLQKTLNAWLGELKTTAEARRDTSAPRVSP
jgi:Polyketide cyclase / dehydrase and lipid transport